MLAAAVGVLLSHLLAWVLGALALVVLALDLASTRQVQEYLPAAGRLPLVRDHALERQPALPRGKGDSGERIALADRAEALAARLRALCVRWEGRIAAQERRRPFDVLREHAESALNDALAEYERDHSVETHAALDELVDAGVIDPQQRGLIERPRFLDDLRTTEGNLREAATRLREGARKPDPAALADAYSAWLVEKRAGLPRYEEWERDGTLLLYHYHDDESARAYQAEQARTGVRDRATVREVEREARVEYHERFRAGVLALVGEANERVRDPQGFEDLAVIESLLLAAKPRDAEDVAAFRQFADEFAGWFKAANIEAPPDMTETLGADYESDQGRKVVDGEISPGEYERSVQSFTERREWARKLRADYQRNWRATATRWLEWARASGVMEGEDYIALVVLDNPQDDTLGELVAAVGRIRARL